MSCCCSGPTPPADHSKMNLGSIAKNLVKSATADSSVTLESFWATSPCVITFFRRFGWPYCRLAARQLSSMKPILDRHNVRFIGVGVEELGVEEFVAGKFFDGGEPSTDCLLQLSGNVRVRLICFAFYCCLTLFLDFLR